MESTSCTVEDSMPPTTSQNAGATPTDNGQDERVPTSTEVGVVMRPAFLRWFWFSNSDEEKFKCSQLSLIEEKAIEMEYRLFEASHDGDMDKISELLSFGVSVDAHIYNRSIIKEEIFFRTPLQVAAACDHASCVRLLLNHGADPNAADFSGVTPLMYAAAKGHVSSVKALLAGKVNLNLSTIHCFEEEVNKRTIRESSTALHIAVTYNKIECVRELIQHGIDCSALDSSGRTSLYIASLHGFRECVYLHLDNATSYDFLSLPCLHPGDTPLHRLVLHPQIEDCAQALIRLGADVNYKSNNGYSPLHIALAYFTLPQVTVKVLRTMFMEARDLDTSLLDLTRYPVLQFICSESVGEMTHRQSYGSCGNHFRRRPKLIKFLLAYGISANVCLPNSLTLLEHELNVADDDMALVKRVVDCLPSTRGYNNLSLVMPQEFTVDPRRRKSFAHALLAHLRNVSPPKVGTPRQQTRELYLTSDDPTIADGLRVFWVPERMVSEGRAETYIAFHLANARRVADLSYNIFISDLNKLWRRWCMYMKHTWYHDVKKSPRSLKASCRYAVRNSLEGISMARNIKKLHIPNYLQSYLLFFEDSD